MTNSYAEIPASEAEILDASLKEVNELKTKGYKAKNLRDFWYDREIADIKKHLNRR